MASIIIQWNFKKVLKHNMHKANYVFSWSVFFLLKVWGFFILTLNDSKCFILALKRFVFVFKKSLLVQQTNSQLLPWLFYVTYCDWLHVTFTWIHYFFSTDHNQPHEELWQNLCIFSRYYIKIRKFCLCLLQKMNTP